MLHLDLSPEQLLVIENSLIDKANVLKNQIEVRPVHVIVLEEELEVIEQLLIVIEGLLR